MKPAAPVAAATNLLAKAVDKYLATAQQASHHTQQKIHHSALNNTSVITTISVLALAPMLAGSGESREKTSTTGPTLQASQRLHRAGVWASGSTGARSGLPQSTRYKAIATLSIQVRLAVFVKIIPSLAFSIERLRSAGSVREINR